MTKINLPVYLGMFCFSMFAVFLPLRVLAESTESEKCSEHGYTVAFINGIFDSREKAQANATALELALGDSHNAEPIHVELAYNAEHLGGAGDLIETVSQLLFNPVSNYDLHDLLQQLATIDTTQKLLVVGYSQGALYANSIYEYFIENGESSGSLGLYAIATPSSYVAGGGNYINSKEDTVIELVRNVAKTIDAPLPLPGNFNPRGEPDTFDLSKTHSFDVYLAGAHKRIVSEIHHELDQLRQWKNSTSKKKNCLSSPKRSVTDLAQQTLFSVVDPAAAQIRPTIVLAYERIVVLASNAITLMRAGYAAASSILGIGEEKVAEAKNNSNAVQKEEKEFGFVKTLYGSSLDQTTYEELSPNNMATVTSEPASSKSEFPVSEPITTTFVIDTSGVNRRTEAVYSGGTALPSPQETTPEIAVIIASSTQQQEQNTNQPTAPVSTTSPETPTTVELENSPISDTFDSFNNKGWKTFGQNVKNFDFNDGEDGECFRKGCVVGMGGNVYDTLVPRMFIQEDVDLASGAYTLYAKARAGFNNPFPAITICASGYESCLNEGSAKGIHFISMIPLDDTWHHYYFAWKQGNEFVQSCFMQDYHHFSDCIWVDTEYPKGTKFNGIALWSTNGWRADVAPHANLWFDELKSP
ncbi:hypothetical protein K2Q08_01075 [Patescibacteria group bacterium]|nr:hypothetical protein [Patescibacteria group bacterium]